MKLRLAVFNTQPPIYLGGVERRILEISKRLETEVETTVYSGTKGGLHEPTTINNTKIIPCASTDWVFPLDNWTFNRTLSKMVGTIRADVYEAHNVSGYGFLRGLQKRRQRVPFITTVHGVLADEYAQAKLQGDLSIRLKAANFFMKRLGNIEKESATDSDLVVTISYYSQRKIIELYGVDPKKIRIVPNGVDPQRFSPSAKETETFVERINAKNRPIVLFVGRLIPRKGLSYLVKAASEVVRERKETLFVIVGNGPLKSRIVNELEKANLTSNFLFLGDVSEQELPKVYGCADVFAFPSIQEGQGIVLLEAQASAKPVVAFKVSGVTEAVVDGLSGYLVKLNVHDFAQAVLRLLADANLRQTMGNAGRDRVLKELTWDVSAKKMLEVYQEAKQLK